MEEIVLTSVGVLKTIGHPSFKFFESKLRAEVFYRSMLYWHTMKGLPDNEVIEFMKEVAEFLEMNDLAWRELMHLFHDIRPGRAKLALWKLFETAAKMEHVSIFKSTTAIMASPQRTSHKAWSSREWSPSQVHLDAGGAHQGPQARLRGDPDSRILRGHLWCRPREAVRRWLKRVLGLYELSETSATAWTSESHRLDL